MPISGGSSAANEKQMKNMMKGGHLFFRSVVTEHYCCLELPPFKDIWSKLDCSWLTLGRDEAFFLSCTTPLSACGKKALV